MQAALLKREMETTKRPAPVAVTVPIDQIYPIERKIPESYEYSHFGFPSVGIPYLSVDGNVVIEGTGYMIERGPRAILRKRDTPKPCTPDEQELKVKFLTEQVVALEGKTKDLTSQRDALRDIQRTSDHQRLEMDQLLSRLNLRNDELKKELTAVRSRVEEEVAKRTKLTEQNAELLQQVATLKSQLGAATSECLTLNRAVDDQKKRIQSLRDQNGAQGTKLEEFRCKIAELTVHADDADTLATALQSANRMRAAAEERCEELQKQNKKLQAKSHLDIGSMVEKNESQRINLNAIAESVAKLNALVEQYNGPARAPGMVYDMCFCNGAGCNKCNSQGRG